MSKTIPLTRGKVCVIDDVDYEWLSQHKWCYANNGYAVSRIDGKTVCMHRLLLSVPPKHYVDHIDRDKLNNCRSNLRSVTPTQSLMNQRARVGLSLFRGVSFAQGKWTAIIKVDGVRIDLGRFLTQREAASAYNQAAIKYFGEYAAPNDLSILDDKSDSPLGSRRKSSKYTGVKWVPSQDNWQSRIMVNRVQYYLGTFPTELEAAQAYDDFVKEHGVNRPLNFPKT